MDHQPQAGIPAPAGEEGFGRGAVVAVAAGVDPQLGLGPDGEGVADRRGDNPFLPPRRDQHGGMPHERPVVRCFLRYRNGARTPGQPKPDPGQVYSQLVGRPDDEKDAREKQQLVLDERQPLQRGPCPQRHLFGAPQPL